MARPRRLLSEEDRRKLVLQQGDLSALSQHPAWAVLEEAAQRRIEVYTREIAAKIFAGEGIDSERQAFMRGFVKGMRYVLAMPGGAEASLERYLQSQKKEEEVAS